MGSRNPAAGEDRFDPSGLGAWVEELRMVASDRASLDNLGFKVAFDGDVVVAGAPFDFVTVDNQGSAYMYTIRDCNNNVIPVSIEFFEGV